MSDKQGADTTDIEMTMHQVLAICGLVTLVDAEDLSALLNQFSFEEATGPVIDPTRYRTVMGKFHNAKEAARAFADFHRKIRQLQNAEQDRIGKEMS